MEYGEKDQYASDDEDGEDYEYEDTYEYEDGEYSPVSHGIEGVSTPPGPKAEEKGCYYIILFIRLYLLTHSIFYSLTR